MARGLFTWLFVAFFLIGCGDLTNTVCVAECEEPTIPVFVSTGMDSSRVQQLLSDAEDILGLKIDRRDSRFGSIVLDIHRVDLDENIRGKAIIVIGCRRAVWSHPNANYIAHELAHALGLDLNHVEDVDNLMSPWATGTELTERQHTELRSGARLLNLCDPGD